jgi:hypothetical protein
LEWKVLLMVEGGGGGGNGEGTGAGEGQSSHVKWLVASVEVATVRLTTAAARRTRRRPLRDRDEGMVFRGGS